MKPCTFITGNQSKADYFTQLLGMPVEHRSIDLDEIQSTDLRAVVEHKARQAYEVIHTAALVEDVSLEFSSLNGLPGTFIKFFVEQTGLVASCQMLDGFADRSATAKCGYGYFDGSEFRYFEGSVHGTIAQKPGEGKRGFGWDRIFIPEGYNGVIRSDLPEDLYNELYLKIKPIEAVREFLASN